MPKKTALEALDSIALADEEEVGDFKVKLPDSVRGNLRVMRWLHHRVVDVMADQGLVDWLVHDVEARLTSLRFEIVHYYVTDLLREARASVKTSTKPSSKLRSVQP